MRETILRRIEALEERQRVDDKTQSSFLAVARSELRDLVLGYYLGELKADEQNASDACARALNYESHYEVYVAMVGDPQTESDREGLRKRAHDAYRRLFAKVGLDFDNASSDVLFDAFCKMVDGLPEHWLLRMRSSLLKGNWMLKVPAGYARFPPHTNIPCGITAENYLSQF